MKVKLEQSKERSEPFHPPFGGQLHYPGIILESENAEERNVLEEIWLNRGRPVVFSRLRNKQVELIVAPTPPHDEASNRK